MSGSTASAGLRHLVRRSLMTTSRASLASSSSVSPQLAVAPGDVPSDAKVQPGRMTDAALVQRVLEGDVGAYAALLDRHAPVCLRYATRMLGNREDAEDAAQEAFVRAYSALARYEGRTAFRTWLFAILINRCRSVALYRSRRERRVSTDEDAVATATVADPTIATELREEIH